MLFVYSVRVRLDSLLVHLYFNLSSTLGPTPLLSQPELSSSEGVPLDSHVITYQEIVILSPLSPADDDYFIFAPKVGPFVRLERLVVLSPSVVQGTLLSNPCTRTMR